MSIDNLVEGLRTDLKKLCPQNHPIEDHPIAKKDEYIRKMYIDMLCVIAQYANEDAEKRLAFVERIHKGSGLNTDFSEHIKNAMNINLEKLQEFFKQCKENDLTVIFVVDGLLISCADGVPNAKQVAFAAEMADALGLKKKDVEILSELAVAILEQSNEKYKEVCKKIPQNSVEEIVCNVSCYLKEFVSGVIIDTGKFLWIYSNEKSDIDFAKEGYEEISGYDSVIVENVCFTDFPTVENVVNLKIKDCVVDRNYLYEQRSFILTITKIINFVFENSEVRNILLVPNMRSSGLSNSVFNFKSCENVVISNSSFKNILSNDRKWGFIAGAWNIIPSFSIKNCVFINCISVTNLEYDVEFENNTFQNCEGQSNSENNNAMDDLTSAFVRFGKKS